MKAIFLSDTHLTTAGNANYDLIERFVRSLSTAREKIDRLYILGDFFDFWFAKGSRIHSGYERIIAALTALRNSGAAIYFAEGNHEFFTEEFLPTLEIETTDEHFDFKMDGFRFFAAHGDDYCKVSRIFVVSKLFLKSELAHIIKTVLPLKLVWSLASFISRSSRRYSNQGGNEIAKQMQPFAEGKFFEGYDVVILGHSHFPSITEKLVDGKRKWFVTLGDWLNGNSCYLSYNSGNFELKSYA